MFCTKIKCPLKYRAQISNADKNSNSVLQMSEIDIEPSYSAVVTMSSADWDSMSFGQLHSSSVVSSAAGQSVTGPSVFLMAQESATGSEDSRRPLGMMPLDLNCDSQVSFFNRCG